MHKYPNQRTIVIHSSSGQKEVKRPYGLITKKELQTAYYVLDDRRNGTPIMLYFVLSTNQDGFQFDFSPAALEAEYGIAADRWRKAFGVLVKKKYLTDTGKNKYIFHSYPKEYQNISFVHAEDLSRANTPADEDIPADEVRVAEETEGAIPPPTVEDTPADRVILPPSTGEDTPADRDRNNKNNIYIINDNTDNNSSIPNEKIIDTISALEAEQNSILEDIYSSFGLWENIGQRINAAKAKAKHTGERKDLLDRQIKELKKLNEKLKSDRKYNMQKARYEYIRAIKMTRPRCDNLQGILECTRVDKILESFEKKYKDTHNGRGWPWTWGVWIDGWNEELQEPNFCISFNFKPLSAIKKQRHNLNGIPEWYFDTLRKS